MQVVQDDARSYVQNSKERFDLIVFSLLDSHTTNSHFTNIRIDNYVYTLEALEQTKQLLKPDGVLVVKFQVDTPWIAGRLHGLLSRVFGYAPLQIDCSQSLLYSTGGRFFITGSEARIHQAIAESSLAAYVKQHDQIAMQPTTLTTDDWPYFYQRAPGPAVTGNRDLRGAANTLLDAGPRHRYDVAIVAVALLFSRRRFFAAGGANHQ